MRVVLMMMALAVVSACGADGAPQRPPARVDVGVNSSGVSLGGSVQTGIGNINVGLGNIF